MTGTETVGETGAEVEAESETDDERETTPPHVREDVLDRDKHQCQLCGALGLGAGGATALEVHHKLSDPDYCSKHDPENLITLCENCHSWMHKRPTGEDLPISITDADRQVLLPHDYQILQVLRRDGPLTTGEVQDSLPLDLSALAIRERLYLMMGMDHEVESRDEPLIDQDAITGEWGLPDQIAESARGRIPDDTQLLIRRVNDERVRRALDRGCDRQMVAEAYGIARRTTWHKQRRAQAYEFPLDPFDKAGPGVGGTAMTHLTGDGDAGGAGGESSGSHGDGESGDEEVEGGGSEQLRLDTVPDGVADGTVDNETVTPGSAAETGSGDDVEVWPPGHAEQDGAGDTVTGGEHDRDASSDGSPADIDALQSQLDRAIAALQAIDASLDASTES